MSPAQTHFELFGLPARYALDTGALEARWRELQREVHPDRFSSASQAEQRASMQLATRVNEAYQVLRSPVKRAEYLLELNGVDPQFETNTSMPQEFLLEQLDLRDALADASRAGDSAALARIAARLKTERDTLLGKVAAQLDRKAWTPAAATLRQLMFFERLREEIGEAEERMAG